jgi:hypothetical protein
VADSGRTGVRQREHAFQRLNLRNCPFGVQAGGASYSLMHSMPVLSVFYEGYFPSDFAGRCCCPNPTASPISIASTLYYASFRTSMK